MVLIAFIMIISLARGRKETQPLSEEEEAKLAELQAARKQSVEKSEKRDS
jgi:hypothetical protein